MLRRVFAFFFLLTLAAAPPARADEAFRIYDARGVRAIFDITNSGVGLPVQDLAKARDRIVIFDSASSSDLTGKACSSNGVQWNADNWSNGVALMRLLIKEKLDSFFIKEKLDSFFFITADYAFGASLEGLMRPRFASAPRRLRPVR
jgi:branched-chain amino acid transport system substrate-binding protein